MKSVISGCRGTWREVQLALIGVASESSVCWCESGPSKWLAGITCLLSFPAELLCCIAAHHQGNESLAGGQLVFLSDPCSADAELPCELRSVPGSTAWNKDILEFSPVNLFWFLQVSLLCDALWSRHRTRTGIPKSCVTFSICIGVFFSFYYMFFPLIVWKKKNHFTWKLACVTRFGLVKSFTKVDKNYICGKKHFCLVLLPPG